MKNVDLQDACYTYEYSTKHLNACYDFFCKHEQNPALIDLVEAIIAHAKAQVEAEHTIKACGVAETDVVKTVFAIANQDSSVL